MLRTGINWRLAPDSELPLTDPHGTPWASLDADELRDRAGWCMQEAQHEALRRARADLQPPRPNRRESDPTHADRHWRGVPDIWSQA